jgi:hypothetical protein
MEDMEGENQRGIVLYPRNPIGTSCSSPKLMALHIDTYCPKIKVDLELKYLI